MSVNWTIEDNVVALYLAIFGNEGLHYVLSEIEEIIANTLYRKEGFKMRVQNYRYIVTDGRKGLDAGYPDGFPLYKELYEIFREMPKEKFKKYVNMILEKRNQFEKQQGQTRKTENY